MLLFCYSQFPAPAHWSCVSCTIPHRSISRRDPIVHHHCHSPASAVLSFSIVFSLLNPSPLRILLLHPNHFGEKPNAKLAVLTFNSSSIWVAVLSCTHLNNHTSSSSLKPPVSSPFSSLPDDVLVYFPETIRTVRRKSYMLP